MKKAYLSPEMEIEKFSVTTSILTDSVIIDDNNQDTEF